LSAGKGEKMSIIRQRSKNLLISGAIGFFIAWIIILLVYLLLVRGNQKIIDNLRIEHQAEETVTKEEEIPMTKVIVLNSAREKDTIITMDMLQGYELETALVPEHAMRDAEVIVGKKLAIDLDANTILSEGFLMEVDAYRTDLETVEITNIRIPENLQVSDRINLRIHYPTGQDYTLVENKKVTYINEDRSGFYIPLSEEEILSFSSGREDANIYQGTEVYVTKEKTQTVYSMPEEALVYDAYPLNPNAQALSQKDRFDEELLGAREVLDESLILFFDQESERYAYALNKEMEDEENNLEEGSDQTQDPNKKTKEDNKEDAKLNEEKNIGEEEIEKEQGDFDF